MIKKILVVLTSLSFFSIASAAANVDTLTVGTQSGTHVYGTISTSTYALSAIGNGNGSVVWSATNLPAGVTFSASPSNGNGAWSRNLSVMTASSTPAGVYTITFTATGNRSASTTATLTVNKANQSVAFTVPGGATYTPGLKHNLATLNGHATSNLPVTYRASGACTVDSDYLYINSAGICFVSGTQLGDSNYNPTTYNTGTATDGEQRSRFIISKSTQSIIGFTAPIGKVFSGANVVLGAYTTSGNPVVYRASGSCTVSGNVLTAVAPGNCAVSVSSAATKSYLATSLKAIIFKIY